MNGTNIAVRGLSARTFCGHSAPPRARACDPDPDPDPRSNVSALKSSLGDASPRHGFVYASVFGDLLKIGFTTNPAKRHRALAGQTVNDGEQIGWFKTTIGNARLLERWLHAKFGAYRLDGEWFRTEPAFVDRVRELFRDERAMIHERTMAQAARRELHRSHPKANTRVVTVLARELVQQSPPELSETELTDLVKDRCAALHIDCNTDVAGRAVRSALYLIRRRKC